MSNALPTPQDAFSTLQNKAAADVFFQRLASHGFSPTNEKEAGDLMELAGKLRVAEQESLTKTAGVDSRFSQANAAIDNVMAVAGLDTPVKAASVREEDAAFANYARHLAADPELYNSVLSVKQAQADEVAAQYNLA